MWDPVQNRSFARGGVWNSFTGTSTSSTTWLAKEVVAPRPWPILPLNNGTFIGVFADQAGLEGSLNFRNSGANDLNVALSVELETSDQFSLYAGGGFFQDQRQ